MLFRSIFTLFSLLSLVSCFALFPKRNIKRDDILSTFFNIPGQENTQGAQPTSVQIQTITNANTPTTITTSVVNSPISTIVVVTSTPNMASFYADFISSRYSYVNENQDYFKTHSFSNLGSLSNEFSALMTYTDGSFSTYLAANPSLTQLLSSVAPQFPWYDAWYSEHVGKARQTVNAAAPSVSAPIFNSKGNMGFLTIQVAVLFTTLIFVTFWY